MVLSEHKSYQKIPVRRKGELFEGKTRQKGLLLGRR